MLSFLSTLVDDALADMAPWKGLDSYTNKTMLRSAFQAATLSQIVYDDAPPPDGSPSHSILHFSHQVEGFMKPQWMIAQVMDGDNSYLALVFRGSASGTDALINALFFPEDVDLMEDEGDFPAGVSAHGGILSALKQSQREIQEEVERQSAAKPELPWTICGHSLGGALALLAGVVFRDFQPLADADIYTFGAPLVLASSTSSELVEIPGLNPDRVHCFVHRNDIVPRLMSSGMEVMSKLKPGHSFDTIQHILKQFTPFGSFYYLHDPVALLAGLGVSMSKAPGTVLELILRTPSLFKFGEWIDHHKIGCYVHHLTEALVL